MITTTNADKVQERRSESSAAMHGDIVGCGGFPHCDRDHKLPGSPNDRVRLSCRRTGSTDGCAAPAALTAFMPQRCNGRLVQAAATEAFMGSGDVTNRNLHSADDWLDADARRP